MKNFVILLATLISVLAVQLLLVVFGLPIESLIVSFVVAILLLFHRGHKEYIWEDNYFLGLGYLALSTLIQVFSFFPELFVFTTLVFAYLVVIAAVIVVAFWKIKFQSLVFVVFGIILFPLLGLVEFWGMTKIWGIVIILFVSAGVVFISPFFQEDIQKKQRKILKYSVIIIFGMSVLVAGISTIVQFWVSEAWYGGSKMFLVVIILGGIGTGIGFFVRKEKKRRQAAAEAEAERKAKKAEQDEREKQLVLQKQQEAERKAKKAAFTKKIVDGEKFLFSDVYSLFGNDIPKEILLHLTEESLDGMFTVSTVKSQIIFDRRLVQALFDAYEHLFFFSFDDDELKTIAEKLNIVLSRISALQFKTGYDSIIQIVGSGKKLEMYKQLKIKDYQKYSPNNL